MTISLERLVIAVLEELSLEYSPGGSVTLKRAEMSAEKELHFCYYIQNEARVRGKKEIDLTQDPPPDLAVEIGMTSSSLNQLALYADFWRGYELP
jgi:Uma2 family endonuclease